MTFHISALPRARFAPLLVLKEEGLARHDQARLLFRAHRSGVKTYINRTDIQIKIEVDLKTAEFEQRNRKR